ncbi:MAG: hypothetical protein J7L89_01480, partial [Bacteroidales bacterium]|nr:hypothetical protein [Bacteroidales bacterium]
MKLWYLLLFVFWPWVWSVGQEQLEERIFPEYPVPDVVRMKGGMSLPNRVDNSKFKFFPDVISQYSWSCNQASSIGYTLTYELNRVRNADASLPENQYAYLYPWSFLMSLNHSNPGVSYFDTWEIVKAGGCPNLVDFPYRTSGVKWMSGYDRYYRAMFNRVFEDYSLPVGTPEDLNVLKRYLFDHFEGSPFGGIVSCQIASQGMHIQYLGKNTTDPGAPILTGFGTGVGHALTIVGYDDRIRLDLNHDGQFTNDLDINGDHLIDLNDYEKGALIAYNSWGDWLNRRGKFYIAYSVLARYGYQGGFWNRSVHLPVVARSYE